MKYTHVIFVFKEWLLFPWRIKEKIKKRCALTEKVTYYDVF